MQTNNNNHNKKPREITIIIITIIWKHCYYKFAHFDNFNATSNAVMGIVICMSVTHNNGIGQM